MINEVGTLVLFLPPYFPDNNPVEEVFSKLNEVYEMELEMEHLDLEDIVASLLRTVNVDSPLWNLQHVVMCIIILVDWITQFGMTCVYYAHT